MWGVEQANYLVPFYILGQPLSTAYTNVIDDTIPHKTIKRPVPLPKGMLLAPF